MAFMALQTPLQVFPPALKPRCVTQKRSFARSATPADCVQAWTVAAAAVLASPEAANCAEPANKALSETPAAVIASAISPVFGCFTYLFLARVIMSWYPNIINVNKLPFVIAYAPTEPVLAPTRRLIPTVGGVDMAPVAWVALVSLANELVLGPQGLLILLAQQQSQQ